MATVPILLFFLLVALLSFWVSYQALRYGKTFSFSLIRFRLTSEKPSKRFAYASGIAVLLFGLYMLWLFLKGSAQFVI
jgi:hypothetical protein